MIGLDCPTDRRLADYLVGRVSAHDLDDISAHLESCEKCPQRLSRLESETPFDGLRAETARATPPPDALTRILGLETPRDLRTGQRIRDYLLLDQIGEGGMGTVYQARHERLDRTVALKVIRHGSHLDPASIARFEREMRAVGKLRHPAIVQATDAGECDGTLYLVMEFVEGENLARKVKENGPFSVPEAVRIIRQAAAGLQHAHDAGMIHRDLKPSNLMLDPAGEVKILDLGLAMFTEAEEAVPATAEAETVVDRASDLTSPSRALGTFDYMAPEQHRNPHTVDACADVYSLGATLWYLLTGKPPGAAEALQSGSLPGGLPPEVWHKFLAADKTQRFASAAAASAALAPYDRSAVGRRRLWPYATAACALIGLAVVWSPWKGKTSEQSQVQAPPEPVPLLSPGKLPMTDAEAVALQKTWADHRGEPVFVLNTIGMKMALIPPGEFGLASECRVRITRPYRIGTTEVTRGQFRKFVEASKYVTDSERTGAGGDIFDRKLPYWTEYRRGLTWREPGVPDLTDDHPIMMVSHNDAVAFCQWLSEKEQASYRLPTEAEWVWACRAGSALAQPHEGNMEYLKTFCWYRSNSGDRLQPVAQLLPNAWGLHDMHGNVSEKCGDPYGSLPVGQFEDYAGTSGTKAFVSLGEMFFTNGVDLYSRAHGDRSASTTYTGFRVVKEYPAPLPPVAKPDTARPAGGTLPMTQNEFQKLQRQWAEHLQSPTIAKDRFSTQYMLIPPGGPFTVANDTTATLTKPYYLGITEVTCAEFARFVDDNPGFKTSVETSGKGLLWYGDPDKPNRQKTDPELNWRNPGCKSGPDYPVTYVSYEDAKAYCAWLSRATKQRYRLPTEAEWRWACRGGTTSPYYTGDKIESLAEHEWIKINAQMKPHPVGTKKPNLWGLRDMDGNVSEIAGELTVNGHRTPGHFVDPRGPEKAELVATVGNSYISSSDPRKGVELILVVRPNVGTSKLGFRVLREIDEPPKK